MTTKQNPETTSDEPVEKTSALDFTAEERAAADTSVPDPHQWEKRDGTYEGDDDAPVLED